MGSVTKDFSAEAIAPEGEVIDVFQAAGLPQPNCQISFWRKFADSNHKNVAAELLAKLLGDEIKTRSKRNLVQSREFSAVTRVKELRNRSRAGRPGFQMLKMP